jgi:hypothetical protein
MKRHYFITLILLALLALVYFIPSDIQISKFYRDTINTKFSTIPVYSVDGKCAFEKYGKEHYYSLFIGPPFVMTLSSGPGRGCWLFSKISSIETLNLYNEYFIKNGWQYEESNERNLRIPGSHKCFYDDYSKNGYGVRVTNCPSMGNGIRLVSANPEAEKVLFTVGYTLTNDELMTLRMWWFVLLSIKCIVVANLIVFAIRTFRNKQI